MYFFNLLRFMFSKKAKKIDKIFTVDLTSTKLLIDGEDFVKFYGLLRKHKLYWMFLRSSILQ